MGSTFDYTQEERDRDVTSEHYMKFYIETPIEDIEVVIGDETTEVINVACQIVDPAGDPILEQFVVRMIMFTSDAYDTLDAAMTGVTTAIGTDGFVLEVITTSIDMIIRTDDEGKFDIDFTDASDGGETSFLGFILPNGKFIEGGAILFVDDTP